MHKKCSAMILLMLAIFALRLSMLAQEEPVWFNGMEVGAYYRWSVSGGTVSTISITVDDMYVEEDFTVYYLTYKDSNNPNGLAVGVNLTWEESIMLLSENANISLPGIATYLWWNASFLDYATENRTIMEEYNISDIEYGDIMYGLSPRKVLIVYLDNAEIVVDMGTGIALHAVIEGISVNLVETNMIWRHAILLSIILLIVFCVLSIIFLRIGIGKKRGEKS